ncbi:MAG: TlpA disulfide reductase family protein [Pseudomonadales bacterium]
MPAPDFIDIEGQGHRYEEIDDKWIIVNYWATWCGPCIKEIPELNELAHEQADRIRVFGVNWDEPEGEKRLEQAKKMKIEFPVYREDPSGRLGIEKPNVLPTTYLFAPGLVLVEELIGPQTRESILEVVDRTSIQDQI